jgi:sporulation integral membrane protein YlbJ
LFTGLTSGYPLGAKTVAELRADGQLTQPEAQRLAGFCNNAGPLFLLGAVGSGMYGNKAAGYCLWVSNILSALVMGLALRNYNGRLAVHTPRRTNRDGRIAAERNKTTNGLYLSKNDKKDGVNYAVILALGDYRAYRKNNDCSFPHILGESVKNAVESVTVIGGFIILFSVAAQMLETTGVLVWLTGGKIAGNPLANGIVTGLLEATNGVKQLSRAALNNGLTPSGISTLTLRVSLAAASAVISFGGFSIHAQTIHFIKNTDIKTAPYLVCKGAGAVLAGIICGCLFPLFL